MTGFDLAVTPRLQSGQDRLWGLCAYFRLFQRHGAGRGGGARARASPVPPTAPVPRAAARLWPVHAARSAGPLGSGPLPHRDPPECPGAAPPCWRPRPVPHHAWGRLRPVPRAKGVPSRPWPVPLSTRHGAPAILPRLEYRLLGPRPAAHHSAARLRIARRARGAGSLGCGSRPGRPGAAGPPRQVKPPGRGGCVAVPRCATWTALTGNRGRIIRRTDRRPVGP